MGAEGTPEVMLTVFSLSRRAFSCCTEKELRAAWARASSAAAFASFLVLLLLLVLRSERDELLRFHFMASALVASIIGWQRETVDRVGVHRLVREGREGSELVVDCSKVEFCSRVGLAGTDRFWY